MPGGGHGQHGDERGAEADRKLARGDRNQPETDQAAEKQGELHHERAGNLRQQLHQGELDRIVDYPLFLELLALVDGQQFNCPLDTNVSRTRIGSIFYGFRKGEKKAPHKTKQNECDFFFIFSSRLGKSSTETLEAL